LRQWQGNRHHCFKVIDGLWPQSVGTVLLHPAKALGVASLTHRAGVALASSVTMRPFLSRAFVKKSHIVTFARSTVGWAGQWQRLGTAIAKWPAIHSQLLRKDGCLSAVALGVGLGSLAHRG
jgi:hypothetical protein